VEGLGDLGQRPARGELGEQSEAADVEHLFPSVSLMNKIQ
jgi:hypothetical protein